MSQNLKLASIASAAAENLQDLVRAHESKILEAWNACEAEAQDNETKPKFRLSLAITLDLDADAMETALSFGIRYKATVNAQIPDPDQAKLDLSGTPPAESPTFTIGPKEARALKRAAEAMRNQ